MSQEIKPYKYFDTPDGQDILSKLLVVLKPTTMGALGISTVDVMLYSHPKGYWQTLGRYAYMSLPIIGMASAFVLTTNMVANLREKDDKVNWVAGAWAAGSIFGIWRRSPQFGFLACGVFSFVAIVKKHGVQNGWVFFDPPKTVRHGGVKSVRQDWTLTAERPRNWTTKKEDA